MLGRNIGFKLTFGVVLTVLVTIGIFAWFNIQSQSRSLLSEVERHASQLSDAVRLPPPRLGSTSKKYRWGVELLASPKSQPRTAAGDELLALNSPATRTS